MLDLADDPALRDRAAGWDGRVRVLEARSQDYPGLRAFLLRPDGYVAWATGPGDAGNRESTAGDRAGALTATLTTWFGPPAPVPARA